mmetsp:Transcript_136554/g.248919  ORF Transcript_136554/g.248919 Transcript_136554/m.248919 type:complete len:221 (+) Transcript_136554:303-965(+)
MRPDAAPSSVARGLMIFATGHGNCSVSLPTWRPEIANSARMTTITHDQDLGALLADICDSRGEVVVTDKLTEVDISRLSDSAQCLVLSVRLIAVIVWNVGTVPRIEKDKVFSTFAFRANFFDLPQHTISSALVIPYVRNVRNVRCPCCLDDVIGILSTREWGAGSLVIDCTHKHVHWSKSWNKPKTQVHIRCQASILEYWAGGLGAARAHLVYTLSHIGG